MEGVLQSVLGVRWMLLFKNYALTSYNSKDKTSFLDIKGVALHIKTIMRTVVWIACLN